MPKRPTMTLPPNVAHFIRLAKNIMYLALAFFSKLSLQREIVILTYHSVDSISDFHAVDPKEFRRQIEYLRLNYTIVSLDEIVDFVKERRNLPRKSVAITFDDGHHDCYLNVLPYFRKNKLSATIFVITGSIGRVHGLTWGEIKEMGKNNIEIGAHTVTHPNLRELSLQDAENEILGSKKEIEKHTKENVNYFSYPFGGYTPQIVDIVRSSGFKAGLGGVGTVRKEREVLVLNRIQVDSSVSFMLFKARLTKAVDWLKRLEQITKKILQKTPAYVFFSSSGR